MAGTKPRKKGTLSNTQIKIYATNLHRILKHKDLDNEYWDVKISWDGKNVIMTTKEDTFKNHDVLVVLRNFISDFDEDEQEPFIY